MNSSGFSIIRWQSSGKSVTRRSDFTTGGPIVEVGHKMPIHNIHMDDARATFLRGAHLFAQTGKVRGKNRRCQLDQRMSLRTVFLRTLLSRASVSWTLGLRSESS